jgi:hypothetical protein
MFLKEYQEHKASFSKRLTLSYNPRVCTDPNHFETFNLSLASSKNSLFFCNTSWYLVPTLIPKSWVSNISIIKYRADIFPAQVLSLYLVTLQHHPYLFFLCNTAPDILFLHSTALLSCCSTVQYRRNILFSCSMFSFYILLLCSTPFDGGDLGETTTVPGGNCLHIPLPCWGKTIYPLLVLCSMYQNTVYSFLKDAMSDHIELICGYKMHFGNFPASLEKHTDSWAKTVILVTYVNTSVPCIHEYWLVLGPASPI